MQPQETFKAIDNKLFVFGVQPIDIIITLVGFLFLHGILSSLVVDLVYILFAHYLAKKTKNRPENIFVVLYLYFLTPPELYIGKEEIINEKSTQ